MNRLQSGEIMFANLSDEMAAHGISTESEEGVQLIVKAVWLKLKKMAKLVDAVPFLGQVENQLNQLFRKSPLGEAAKNEVKRRVEELYWSELSDE